MRTLRTVHLIYEDTDAVQGAEVIFTGDFARDWEPAALRERAEKAEAEVARLRSGLSAIKDDCWRSPEWVLFDTVTDRVESLLTERNPPPLPPEPK